MTDITWLVIAVILGMLHLVIAAQASQKYRTLKWNVGPRDTPMEPQGVAARLDRAYRNFMETFPLFAAALLAVAIQHKTGVQSHWGAVLYVVARIVYVPLYALGIPYVRTLAWAVSVIGIVLLIGAAF